jgi:SAM-dependent methyltransferase
MEVGNLYDRPDLYDLVAPRDPALEGFYVEAALTREGPVLDLACGSGRLSIPLARAGKEVVGGDASPEMLEHARRAAAAAGVGVEFVGLDMSAFELAGRKFATVTVAANSLLHLHSAEQFRGFFRSVSQHVVPEGRLLFDVFVPNAAILARHPDERHPVDVVRHPELGKLTVEETTRYDPVSQISQVTWYWSSEAVKDFWVTPLKLRQVFPHELPTLVEAGGMRVVERYGDFDRSPFGLQSRRQVCVCATA